jgi:hypothetical protein
MAVSGKYVNEEVMTLSDVYPCAPMVPIKDGTITAEESARALARALRELADIKEFSHRPDESRGALPLGADCLCERHVMAREALAAEARRRHDNEGIG